MVKNIWRMHEKLCTKKNNLFSPFFEIFLLSNMPSLPFPFFPCAVWLGPLLFLSEQGDDTPLMIWVSSSQLCDQNHPLFQRSHVNRYPSGWTWISWSSQLILMWGQICEPLASAHSRQVAATGCESKGRMSVGKADTVPSTSTRMPVPLGFINRANAPRGEPPWIH